MIEKKILEKNLDTAVAGLYETFSSYKLKPLIQGCPCCVGKKRERRLHTHSLRQLTEEDLSAYAFKALTTWGDEYDFKHFLPRIFELCVQSQNFIVDREIVFGKLSYANWHSWPLDEHKAIEEYLKWAWTGVLTSKPHRGHQADSWLCAIGQATDDMNPYLEIWQRNVSLSTVQHLSDFLLLNMEPLIHTGSLFNPFWEEHNTQMQQVIDWILRDETIRTFTSALESSPAGELSHDLALVVHFGLAPLREAYSPPLK